MSDRVNHNVKGLLGALVTGLGGIVAGYAAGAINNPKPPVYVEPQPICGCGHHISMHDDDGCHETMIDRLLSMEVEPKTETKRDKEGISRSKTVVPGSRRFENKATPCGCKRYVGPEPMPTFIP